jgi:hypothetical protein
MLTIAKIAILTAIWIVFQTINLILPCIYIKINKHVFNVASFFTFGENCLGVSDVVNERNVEGSFLLR